MNEFVTLPSGFIVNLAWVAFVDRDGDVVMPFPAISQVVSTGETEHSPYILPLTPQDEETLRKLLVERTQGVR